MKLRFPSGIICCLLFFISSCSGAQDLSIPSGYYWQLLGGQFRIWNSLTSNREHFSPAEQDQLKLVDEVLAYARSHGLDVGKNYQEYFSVDGDAVSYTVMATPEFELKFFRWNFPILGSVPYIGFFEKKKAQDYRKTLPSDWDTWIGSVRAFSMLGYAPDPLPTSLLKEDPWELTDTIFHELTHRTVWIKNANLENEQLAVVVAQELTTKFVQDKKKPWNLQVFYKDRMEWDVAMGNLKEKLEILYQEKGKIPDHKLREKKKLVFLGMKSSYPKVSWEKINNTAVMTSQLYSTMPEQLIQARSRCADLSQFLQEIQEKQGFNVCNFSGSSSQ